MAKKDFIVIEGSSEDPRVQKGMLANLFAQIQKDLFFEHMRKLKVNHAINMYDELKTYVMDLFDKVCDEYEAPFSKEFYEKTFDIWWEDGLEKALETDY